MTAHADTFVSRWGDAELDDMQYASVPGWILRNYHKFTDPEGNQVGLTADEFQITVHIMSFKYDVADAQARPSLTTIAAQVGKHISTVRRTVKRMETKKALKVDRAQKGRPNTYDFSNLAKQCRKFEALRLAEIDGTPSVYATPTPSVHATPPLASTLPEDKNKESEESKDSADLENQVSTPTSVPVKETPKPKPPSKIAVKPKIGVTLPTPEPAAAPPKRKRSEKQQRLDRMLDAFVEVFGLDSSQITAAKWGEFRAAGKQLLQVQATPEDIKPLHAWCVAQGWSGFSSMAMAKGWADFIKARTPAKPPAPRDCLCGGHGVVRDIADGKQKPCPVCQTKQETTP